jgi:hypothetical protein
MQKIVALKENPIDLGKQPMYHDFDPFELLEELARQQRNSSELIQILVDNHARLAEAYYEQNKRLGTQGQMIQQLRLKIHQLENGTINETKTRSLR